MKDGGKSAIAAADKVVSVFWVRALEKISQTA